MPPDGSVHGAAVLLQVAADNGVVGSGHGVILQLAGQHGMSQIIFRHRQKPGGILVNPVDNAGAQLSVDARKVIPHGVQKAIHQSVLLMPGGRMHHQPLGLVDHQHILVFVDDIQRHFRSHNIHGLGLRDGILHNVPGIQLVVLFAGLAVAQNLPLLNELLGSGAGQPLPHPGKKGIQPFPGLICR